MLAESGWATPVVAAGNTDAAEAVTTVLGRADVVHEMSTNVVPRIGVLAPESARGAIRAVFLRHVIGGRHLSASAEFVQMLTGPTPDVVLTGAEVLAGLAGDVAVVDVGGATTDVHSVVEVDPEDAVLSRQVVAPTQLTRTVEGDLGMRWSAPSTVDAGTELTAAAQLRAADPGSTGHVGGQWSSAAANGQRPARGRVGGVRWRVPPRLTRGRRRRVAGLYRR